jgi:ATP-binding cassette subfamily B protein/subfamily B ATP-binding cassette protein MsbA
VAVIGWTLSFLRPYRTRVLAISILSVAEIGLTALAPWPLKIVVDSVLGDHPLPERFAGVMASTGANRVALLVVVVVAGLLLQTANEVLRMFQTQLQVDTGQRIVYGLRARLLAHLQDLPLRHHILTRTADSVYRLDADAHCVDDLVIGGVFPLAAAVLNLGVMFVILVYLDPALGLLSLAVVPFLYLCLRYYSRTMTDRAERVKALESTLIDRAFEILSSVAAVKSFARERHELTRYSQSGDEAMRARLSLTWQESLFSVAITAVTLAGTTLVLIVGGLHVLDGRLTVGALLVVVAYLAAVYNPISAIAHTTGSLQQAIVSARRVGDIFALTPETLDAPDALDASAVTGHVRFESVSFSYGDDRRVLDEVSFEARPGEMIALVGVTGAGKTTIASLIPRFFEPTHGRVLVDEVDAARYSLRSLRERIALVPQQPILFSGTIADNIRYGRLQASDEEVEAAARAAHIHDFITTLPNGYQTPVAEAGATLSGGERQRLGIARALVKNAPMLILDEPTSSLDALSEAGVFDALRRLRRGRTTIVIAHRLSTIRNATRILVLQEGQLMAQGTHDELLASNVLYRRMCARLSVGRSLEEPESVDELVRVVP